ncbi:MAG TPA: response regulator [Patescibacteria group bacterium]
MPDKKTILIIEDDRFLSKIYSAKLEKEGYNLALAVDGEEGLRKLAESKPDLILLDLILPGMSGFEVLDKIKSSSKTRKIPVIILSNLGQDEDIQKGQELGADDYLVKTDFSISEVINKIKSALA